MTYKNKNSSHSSDNDSDKENQIDNILDATKTISLQSSSMLVPVNLEEYFEEYIAENYFRIHRLKHFQTQGNNFFLSLSLFIYNTYLSIKTKGWVHSTFHNPKVCHRPHCKSIKDKVTKVIEPDKLVGFRKCDFCQPPVMPPLKVRVQAPL